MMKAAQYFFSLDATVVCQPSFSYLSLSLSVCLLLPALLYCIVYHFFLLQLGDFLPAVLILSLFDVSLLLTFFISLFLCSVLCLWSSSSSSSSNYTFPTNPSNVRAWTEDRRWILSVCQPRVSSCFLFFFSERLRDLCSKSSVSEKWTKHQNLDNNKQHVKPKQTERDDWGIKWLRIKLAN